MMITNFQFVIKRILTLTLYLTLTRDNRSNSVEMENYNRLRNNVMMIIMKMEMDAHQIASDKRTLNAPDKKIKFLFALNFIFQQYVGMECFR